MLRVGVTGASGFVGGAVCRAAVNEGWEVSAFGRRPSVEPGQVGGAPYTPWDLLGARAELPELDVVIHCAGGVTDWGPRREIWAANVDGTRAVAAAFPGARFVHVSTASVYDPFRPTVMATEGMAPVNRYANAYGASKAAAEKSLEKAVVLRPHAVYGRGDTTLLPRILGAVREAGFSRWATGASGSASPRWTTWSGPRLFAAAGPVECGVFNVTDAEPVILDDALRAILKERGIDAEPSTCPSTWSLPWPPPPRSRSGCSDGRTRPG